MDVLIVGCGLCGAVIARHLAEQGKRVTIWERRDHIGGNMYDYVDENGFLVQKYGPHTFHTKKKELFDYMCRFDAYTGPNLPHAREKPATPPERAARAKERPHTVRSTQRMCDFNTGGGGNTPCSWQV